MTADKEGSHSTPAEGRPETKPVSVGYSGNDGWIDVNNDPNIVAFRVTDFGQPKQPAVMFATPSDDLYPYEQNVIALLKKAHLDVFESGPSRIVLRNPDQLYQALTALEWPGIVKEEIQGKFEQSRSALERLQELRDKYPTGSSPGRNL
jgi:hypothetical protein